MATGSIGKGLIILLLLILYPITIIAEIKVHFIDVGQGDAILIQCDGENLLMDGGPFDAGSKVRDYLQTELGVTKLQAVIASHEHDDHLMGLPEALTGMKVEKIYTPRTVPMTWWFQNVLPHLSQDGLQVKKPMSGETFSLGDAEITFLDSLVESEISNNLCIVIRVDYQNTSALFAADLEGDGEAHLLETDMNLKANVLKVGHHGGNTSTTDAFLKAVDPQYAVISVGKGNKHGHPHAETLSKLLKRDITVYRTDTFGTIVMTSDGETWTVEVKKAR